jgi:hypothetical protein
VFKETKQFKFLFKSVLFGSIRFKLWLLAFEKPTKTVLDHIMFEVLYKLNIMVGSGAALRHGSGSIKSSSCLSVSGCKTLLKNA